MGSRLCGGRPCSAWLTSTVLALEKKGPQAIGRSRGELTTKIHTLVDALGNPVELMLTPGQDHDLTCAEPLIAQEVKQIKLTEKHMQGFIVVSEHMAQLNHGANPDRPDPKLEVQAEALVKKNGFASRAEYDDVSTIIAIVLSGIDRQTKTLPSHQIR
jgi:hypothetical protein